MPRTRPPRLPRTLLCASLALLALLLSALPAGAVAVLGTPVIGPSPAVQSLGGIAIALDGTGALVATVQDGGVDHIFVSRLLGGAWTAPERVDGGLAGPSSQPVVAVGDAGRVSVAFVNSGNVYAITRVSSAIGYSPLQTIWGSGGASDPADALSVDGKGYLVFTAPGGGGHDVRAAYAKDGGPWSLVQAPLDHNPAADAGGGSNRPRVAVSADGTAIAVWGEAGHVFARRVRGLSPSVTSVDANAGLVLEGVQAAATDVPEVATQDDDSYAGVVMHATFAINGGLRSRDVFRRLRGSRFEAPVAVDTTPFGSGLGSGTPHISTNGIGQGIALGEGDTSYLSYAMLLHADVAPGTVQQVDSITPPSAPSYAVPIAATSLKQLVAWQLGSPTGPAPSQIHARFYDGRAFNPETIMSQPALGPTDAAHGLAAAGDSAGDIAVAYAQDVPNQGRAISVAVIDQPPGKFAPHFGSYWQRSPTPLLTWSRLLEDWGLYFKVAIDGVDAGYGDAVKLEKHVRTPLTQGVHSWQVSAFDRLGQTFAAKAVPLRIDSVAPTATATVSGSRRVGATLKVAVVSADAPPPPPAGQQPIATSGVAQVLVDWGDHTRQVVKTAASHAYAKPGRYALRVVVTDHAGNRTVVRQQLTVAGKPQSKPRSKKPAKKA